MRSKVVAWTVAVGLLVAGPAIAAKPVVGFVDVGRLQQEYERARKVRTDLEAETHKYEAELREGQDRLAEIEARIASADAAVRAATSDIEVRKKNEAAKETEESARQKLQAEYAQRLRERRDRAENLQKEINETLIERAKTAVEQVAKKQGLEAVLDSRASLWAALDVTEDVLKILNASPSAK